MYSSLAALGKNYDASAWTDSTKYPCCLSLPSSTSFPPYGTPSPYTLPPRAMKDIPSYQKEGRRPWLPFDRTTTVPEDVDKYQRQERRSLPVFSPEETTFRPAPVTSASSGLLPVLDSRFNLREICKQCILLEDHLAHPEKRCTDCCIKHFLALEGLGEEAVTLDHHDSQLASDLVSLPHEIRKIQQFWYAHPDKNAHQAGQQLRQLRKKFMTDVFNLRSFEPCHDGKCSLKRS